MSRKIEDNITITLKDNQKSFSSTPIHLWDGITKRNYYEVDHIKIDVIDVSEDKLLLSVNKTFNMSNLWNSDDKTDEVEKTPDSDSEKSDSDYEFFKDSDLNGDGLIDFSEFSKISTGQVTFASRDSEFGGFKIKSNDILGLDNGKLVFTEKDPVNAVIRLTISMIKKDTEFITIIYGEGISKQQAEKAGFIEECEPLETELRSQSADQAGCDEQPPSGDLDLPCQ